jgi:hypothetical protein
MLRCSQPRLIGIAFARPTRFPVFTFFAPCALTKQLFEENFTEQNLKFTTQSQFRIIKNLELGARYFYFLIVLSNKMVQLLICIQKLY